MDTLPGLARALAITALAACSGAPRAEPTAAAGPEVRAKKLTLSWGVTPAGELVEVYLAATDQNGMQVSHALGRYKGQCQRFLAPPAMNALTALACNTGGGGTELHAVVRRGEIVILRLPVMDGAPPDPMAREEVARIPIELGIAVEAP